MNTSTPSPVALEFFLNADETGKIGFQRETEKTDKLIREHMHLLSTQLSAGALEAGGIYKVYMRINPVTPRKATVVAGLEAADGSTVEFAQAADDDDSIPF